MSSSNVIGGGGGEETGGGGETEKLNSLFLTEKIMLQHFHQIKTGTPRSVPLTIPVIFSKTIPV